MIDIIFDTIFGDKPRKKHELEDEMETILDQCEDSTKKFIDTLDNATVYIDSNIYMDERFVKLFELLLKCKVDILLLEVQYQEIYGCKKSDIPEQAKSARRAFNFIDKLQEKEILTIEGLGIQSEKKAYADPELIERIIKDLKQDKNVVFITEDKDLKIRLRGQIKKENLESEKIVIFGHEQMEFLELLNKIEILEKSIDNSKVHCPHCNKNVLTYEVKEWNEYTGDNYYLRCCECRKDIENSMLPFQ